jgi:hypothetical protein
MWSSLHKALEAARYLTRRLSSAERAPFSRRSCERCVPDPALDRLQPATRPAVSAAQTSQGLRDQVGSTGARFRNIYF